MGHQFLPLASSLIHPSIHQSNNQSSNHQLASQPLVKLAGELAVKNQTQTIYIFTT